MSNAASPVSGSGHPHPLALTMGDPAGIGGDITLKAWLANPDSAFFIIDDLQRLKRLAEELGFDVPLAEIRDPAETNDVFAKALPVLHRALKVEPVPGHPDPENTGAIIDSITLAVEMVMAGQAAAVVTNPIHKKSLYDAGFQFPGHTEFLAKLAGIDTPPVMMLASSDLKVVPVSVHVSMAQAIADLSIDTIVALSTITARALEKDFAISAPRLAVAGLNPHAGEGGGMGMEESRIIAPAIAKLQELGIDARGPWPPDTLFHAAARETYDTAICMYHDQALIPIKTIDFDGAVNVTLGLPFVRTSPDHGTAYDIAGTGKARETSLLAALQMASDIAARRSQ
ncbi:MAG: 4-hydroxythreonine-4-phosphate dehydrogenase PdxA [Rhodospirillaceae bacterium]|nr:4-hydroxythreonine-4-phosphate dehydrogenase PdxA [Rhodospirillaceae bacterium]